MFFPASDFAAAYAEMFLLAAACVILLADLWVTDDRRDITYYLSLATLVVLALITVSFPADARVEVFAGTFVADQLSDLLKLFSYIVVGVVFVYSRGYLIQRNIYRGEYYVLGLLGLLGIMVMISAHNMLTIYLGLELLSLSLYAMVAFNRDSAVSAEAAMKYFVLGAIASGCLLYGMSILYGVTGTLDLKGLGAVLTAADALDLPLLLGLAFVLVGVAFKLGAVPFHMWIPDVYHGAPTSVTLYIGTAAKIASFALVLRLLVEGLGDLYTSWRDMLIVMSVLSMAIGNLVAIAQTNLKRMLAYSTISHVGFILLGFLAGGPQGTEAALYYTIAYVIMAMGAFGMILLLSRAGFEADRLEDYKGLNQLSPWFAGIMLILMFSMAGVPPFLGFYAKIAVISAVLDAGYVWLAVAAVVFSVIGAFYYLRLIRLMYFDDPDEGMTLEAGPAMRLVLSANGLAVLVLGLFPAGLIAVCARVIQ